MIIQLPANVNLVESENILPTNLFLWLYWTSEVVLKLPTLHFISLYHVQCNLCLFPKIICRIIYNDLCWSTLVYNYAGIMRTFKARSRDQLKLLTELFNNCSSKFRKCYVSAAYRHNLLCALFNHVPLCFMRQIKYSFSCLQCPTMYAQMDQRTGEALIISKAIPLPALNVSAFFLHNRTSGCWWLLLLLASACWK